MKIAKNSMIMACYKILIILGNKLKVFFSGVVMWQKIFIDGPVNAVKG